MAGRWAIGGGGPAPRVMKTGGGWGAETLFRRRSEFGGRGWILAQAGATTPAPG